MEDNSSISASASASTDDDSAATTTTNNNNSNTTDTNTNTNPNPSTNFLRHLNKLSHKISKPSSSLNPNVITTRDTLNDKTTTIDLLQPPSTANLQQQPPVYNINKSDFRDVVQKLTGSPAHPPAARPTHAPPFHPPPSRPTTAITTSRLHRIRPPPLLSVPPPTNPLSHGHHPQGHSPLPPLPSCSAESPISSYFRFLHSNVSFPGEFPPPPQLPFPSFDSNGPASPLPFGCLPSPKSPSPLGFPPQMPISSPK